MARPSNSVENTTKHLTADEIVQRRAAEAATLTNIKITERAEVAKNATAHEEFERVIELLNAVNKNDALIGTVINRYCMLMAECVALESKRDRIETTAVKLEQKLDELEDDATFTETRDAAKAIASMYATGISCEKLIQQKRSMLFNIEKENGFTIAAALRSIPKQVKKENPLAKALRDDD